jgi:hypothetical protein
VLNLTNTQRVLGVYEFLTDQAYSVCCKSIDLCMLQKLGWQQFNEALAELHLEVPPS